MQAILQSKHQRFCNWLQAAREKLPATDHALNELENQLQEHYNEWLRKREDLRLIIQRYEEKQNDIKNKIKQKRLLVSQNTNPEVAVGNK